MEICCADSDILDLTVKDISDKLPVHENCGIRNENGLGGVLKSIQNTTEYVQFAEFPWMVAVLQQQQFSGPKVYLGGGSLIHSKVVLTSADVIDQNSDNLLVRAGEWNSRSESEMLRHEERNVKSVVVHEGFSNTRLHNSVALLELEENFDMKPHINIICLPPRNTNFDGQRCLIAGWDKTQFANFEVYQNYLKKIELPIVESTSCQEMLRKTRLRRKFQLHEGFLCAGESLLSL